MVLDPWLCTRGKGVGLCEPGEGTMMGGSRFLFVPKPLLGVYLDVVDD